ncbi:MAG: hypothetical protein RIT81_31510 [Deltaproteobacteria bacterium]
MKNRTNLWARMRARVEAVGLRRWLAVGLGVGVLVMGIDAGIAHFAGRGMKHLGQLVPVVFGPLAFFAMLFALKTRAHRERFDTLARVVGALTAGVGLLGTAYHGIAFARYFAEGPVTNDLVQMALMLAPPLFAPGAFIGLGAVLFGLASHKVTVTMRPVLLAPAPAC